jgi:arylsulfatase A-like enzyme
VESGTGPESGPRGCLGPRGLLAAIIAGIGALGCSAGPATGDRPNLLLITLDTTRSDRLGLYGYERDTSPNLDRLARDSVVYTAAFSTSSWTLPSHASLFTGKFPTSHGASFDPEGLLILGDGFCRAGYLDGIRVQGLGIDQHTLAELLGDAGYVTSAVVAGPWLKRVFGLDKGFDQYDDSGIGDMRGRLAKHVTNRALAWIDENAGERFFLFLNYYDPHSPYEDRQKRVKDFLHPGAVAGTPDNRTPEGARACYDVEIRYMDRHIGRLLDDLRRRGLYHRTWIIVVGDHGELLGENGKWGHGYDLTQAELRIPLLIKYPRDEAAPRHVDMPVQLTDVFAMVLDRLGIALPPGTQGFASPQPNHRIVAELYSFNPDEFSSSRVLIEGPFKYVWNAHGEQRLFNLAGDPDEAQDRATVEPELVQAMAARLDEFIGALPRPIRSDSEEVRTVDEETTRALRNLGYLE